MAVAIARPALSHDSELTVQPAHGGVAVHLVIAQRDRPLIAIDVDGERRGYFF